MPKGTGKSKKRRHDTASASSIFGALGFFTQDASDEAGEKKGKKVKRFNPFEWRPEDGLVPPREQWGRATVLGVEAMTEEEIMAEAVRLEEERKREEEEKRKAEEARRRAGIEESEASEEEEEVMEEAEEELTEEELAALQAMKLFDFDMNGNPVIEEAERATYGEDQLYLADAKNRREKLLLLKKSQREEQQRKVEEARQQLREKEEAEKALEAGSEEESEEEESVSSEAEEEKAEEEEKKEEEIVDVFEAKDWADLLRRLEERRKVLKDPHKRPRTWEIALYINTLLNLDRKELLCFLVITFGHINPRKNGGQYLRRKKLYSPAFSIKPGEPLQLPVPMSMIKRQQIKLSYANLPNYKVSYDLWEINPSTFNTLFADSSMTLQEIVNDSSDQQIALHRRLADPTRKSYEAVLLEVTCELAEVLEFIVSFDSWQFIGHPDMPKPWQELPKALEIIFPSRPKQKKLRHKRVLNDSINWWAFPAKFKFLGTMNEFKNSYFTVKIYGNFGWQVPQDLMGVCFFSNASVLDYPICKGTVKKLTTEIHLFAQGDVMGNIRVQTHSLGVSEAEPPTLRPVQPLRGASLLTNLDVTSRHLIIKLLSCQNLPAANYGTGFSDPYVKVMWDGIQQNALVQENTCRPIYNQTFYYPIRLIDPKKELSDRHFRETCLPLDLLNKGSIMFEVWHQDDTLGEFLGGCEVSLAVISSIIDYEMRSLAGRSGEEGMTKTSMTGKPVRFKREDEEEEEAESEAETVDLEVSPYERPYPVRVYRAVELPLSGTTVAVLNEAQSTITFEFFILPDLPRDCVFTPIPPSEQNFDIIETLNRRWERDFRNWMKKYMAWFPKAPSNRRFYAAAERPVTRNIYPLPSFLSPLSLPELRTGQFPRWCHIGHLLMSRKGGVNDHALLLCAALLGAKMDAYVWKGTIKGGSEEHCWVMTREEDGFAVFWEVTTREKFHLPSRWGHGPSVVIEPLEDELYYDSSWLLSQRRGGIPNELVYDDLGKDNEVPDQKISLDELDQEWLPDVGSKRTRSSKIDREKKDKYSTDSCRKMLQRHLERPPIAPQKFLLIPEETFVPVPYSTVEVVFNHEQLWGNLQNANPGVITYDFEDEWKWRAFLATPATPITSVNELILQPPLTPAQCSRMADALARQVVESIQLVRNKRGQETLIDESESLRLRLFDYIDLLEFRMSLDFDMDPGPDEDHIGWTKAEDRVKSEQRIGETLVQGEEARELREKEEKGLVEYDAYGNPIIVEDDVQDFDYNQMSMAYQQNLQALHATNPKIPFYPQQGGSTPLAPPPQPPPINHEYFGDTPIIPSMDLQPPPAGVEGLEGEEEEGQQGNEWMSPEAMGAQFLAPPPATRKEQLQEERQKWFEYYERESRLYKEQKRFPCRPNHSFVGFPLHLSTINKSEVTNYLLTSVRFQRLVELDIHDIVFTVVGKMFPWVGGVCSAWLFIGCQVPWQGSRDKLHRITKENRGLLFVSNQAIDLKAAAAEEEEKRKAKRTKKKRLGKKQSAS
ncbi:unnamed protein product [Vitrella brassicaformis CCMP3155]|uniref:C2 domain-containing protein n=2 Tax=Vitrella brassicaformis TaxID=1169539 RepID=A0A0G4EGK2_VITBC|nr:unnamed protein product [Vitrella brassicaformis CCMP3155]|eukprot:CEL94610.1 unnamed protein product [Vitrella brassicaformis CCMP3155]